MYDCFAFIFFRLFAEWVWCMIKFFAFRREDVFYFFYNVVATSYTAVVYIWIWISRVMSNEYTKKLILLYTYSLFLPYFVFSQTRIASFTVAMDEYAWWSSYERMKLRILLSPSSFKYFLYMYFFFLEKLC